MQTVDEQPETIHLYVVREAAPKPSLLPIFLSVAALSALVAFCALIPYQQPVTRAVIRVPAVLLSLKTFTAQVAVIPTGVRIYPAKTAHGVLTITNGSVISQTLPAGLTFISKSGVSVTTNTAVFVPAGSANGYGFATVTAHALSSGKQSNIPAYAINQVEGSSVYVRNLVAFQGGRDAYSVKFITSNDRNVALSKTRTILISKITGLHYPCTEDHIAGAHTVIVTWRCQFIKYAVPSYMRVISVKIVGKGLLLEVTYPERKRIVETK